MKKRITTLFGALFLALAATSLAPASIPDISVSNIDLTKMQYKSKEYGWYLIKCAVGNSSKEGGLVSVKLRAVDKWAYNRDTIELWGHVEAGDEAVLTLKTFTNYKTLQNIRRWDVLQAHLH